MTPFFNPGPIHKPEIPIYIAGVNTGLAKLAGETADGFLVHPFHSPDYLRQVLIPAIQHGARQNGRSPEDVRLTTTAFVVTTPEENFFVRSQIAFYASTPSYRRVMAHHGWEETAEQLSKMARAGAWAEMATMVNDQMLNTFAVVAEPTKLADALLERYQGLSERLLLYLPLRPGERDNFWKTIINTIKDK
jgi:probable F420-dependent oxidoreductase